MATVLVTYFLVLILLGGHSKWYELGVRQMSPVFADLRSVTSAWECTREGIPILPRNPCDPWDRPANYPRLWMAPAFLGLGQGSTFGLGLGIDALFLFSALAIIPRQSPRFETAIYGLAICSPAVMLGVERANVDLMLFALLVAAIFLLRRGRLGTVTSHALVLLGGLLKLFPILATSILLRQGKRAAIIGVTTVVVLFAGYVLITLHQIEAIFRSVPQHGASSYGVQRLSEWMHAAVISISSSAAAVIGALFRDRGFDVVLVVMALAVALLLRRWLRPRLRMADFTPSAGRDLDLFVAGASVYIGSYAVFRSFDYRLAFLLLTMPQVLRWVRDRIAIGFVILAALMTTLWFDAPWESLPVIGGVFRAWDRMTAVGPSHTVLRAVVLGQYVLFGALLATLVALLPSLKEVLGAPSDDSGLTSGRRPSTRTPAGATGTPPAGP